MNENDEFLKTVVNWAVVIKADLRTIEEIKKYLVAFPGINVIYQKASVGKLVVKEDG